MLWLALLLLPVGDELADLALEVHEKTLGAARSLELLAQFLGHDTGSCRLVGYGLGRSLLSDCSGLAFVGLALKAGIPEGSKIVGHVFSRVGRMNFPVLWQWRLGVGIVQETVCLEINGRVLSRMKYLQRKW